MNLNFSIQLFSSMNRQGLEELASVMAGRLNYTLEVKPEFDLSSIPTPSEADADVESEADSDLAHGTDTTESIEESK